MRAFTIKRINKEIKEITINPVEGIGITSLGNDPMKYIVNICLMSGLYKRYCFQLLLTFTDNYPTEPPEILIFPQQTIDQQYNDYIYQDDSKDENGYHFKKICYTKNSFFDCLEWNPSYSIASILIQVQNFIGQSPYYHTVNRTKVEELMKSMKSYKKKFIIKDENGEKEIIHTWENPYPKMFFSVNNNEKEISIHQPTNETIKENLICSMRKSNYIDEPEILLGYPIIQIKGKGKDNYDLYPIPELMAFDGFLLNIGKYSDKLDNYYTTINNDNINSYNYWVPIYIDEKHYLKNRSTILNSFSLIKYGPRDKKDYDFNPEQIFEIMPIILNKIVRRIIELSKGASPKLYSFIKCYFHYALLFKQLSIEFQKEHGKYLNHKLNLIYKNKSHVNKSIIPSVGNFLISLLFFNGNIYGEKMKKLWYSLFEEFVTRQMFSLFNNEIEIEQILRKCEIEINKINYLNKESEIMAKIDKEKIKRDLFREGRCLIKINNNKDFIELLKKEKIYDKIIDIQLSGIYDKKYRRQEIINKIYTDFQYAFNNSYLDVKRNIYRIFEENGKFNDYFKLSNYGEQNFPTKMRDEAKRLFKKEEEKKISKAEKIKFLFDESKNKEILEEFLGYAYKSQEGNNCLLITYFIQKKIEEKGFLDKLKNNYGVYLEVEQFIKDMKKTMKKIKNYKQLFEYIGSEYGKNKSDLELIKEAFKIAKLKYYIKFEEEENNGINEQRERGIEDERRGRRNERGRMRGRGRRIRGR